MQWNWQQTDWPNWRYDAQPLEALEQQFLVGAGRLLGAWDHLVQAERESFQVEVVSVEALKTSEIEGEMLDRSSVQSSVRRAFGLTVDEQKVRPQESGIAELMVACFRDFGRPLAHRTLHDWHALVCRGAANVRVVGGYRTHEDPMQVVSGPLYRSRVHFEAPPSASLTGRMSEFIEWFNVSKLPALTRAGLAHLYFVSVHPFEDGNGRLARALSEKALAQALGQPSLIALARQIEKKRNGYYASLEANNKSMQVAPWLHWFAETALEAQQYSQSLIEHVLAKTKLFDRLRGELNPRQAKALQRVFAAGPEGFVGGLSASNYQAITKASSATARRDLVDLVAKGALRRTGQRKGTRYWLSV